MLPSVRLEETPRLGRIQTEESLVSEAHVEPCLPRTWGSAPFPTSFTWP